MIVPSSPENILKAAALLGSGGVVALPTETVYGLGADARKGLAVAKVYEMKGRPAFNPLIVHVDSLDKATEYAVFDETARHVAALFWPGPLTLVLPLRANSGIDPLVTAGLDTVAIRVPSHPIARAVLAAFGGPVAAPSANRSGTLSPTTPLHVEAGFGADAPLILASGACDVGLESTILDLTTDTPTILRPGAITADDLAGVLGVTPEYAHVVAGAGDAPKSPGLLLKHYAPRLPLRLRAIDVKDGEALLAFGSITFMGIAGGGYARDLPDDRFRNLSEAGDVIEAAANLFRYLHDLDQTGCAGIAVMDIPNVGIGVAINERLRRAASAS